jgi:nucleotide-binding universal stress UspA family protein
MNVPLSGRRPDGAAGRWVALTDAFESPGPAGTPPVRTVLAAVDGTPFGEHALPLAAEIARQAGAALRVVQVFSARDLAGEASLLLADGRWVLNQRRRRGEYLDGLARRLARVHPLPVTAALLDGTDVAEAVCEASASADLVVMATRGRGSWAKFWWGSVTAAVARHARCPVLLVRPRDAPPDLAGARPPRDILVPLDGTERGEEAVRAAVALGSPAGARYDLLHVISAWTYTGLTMHGHGGLTPLPGEMREADAHHYLRGVAARLAGDGAEATTSVVVDDRPVAEAIAAHAERTAAELIALTTRGRGPLSRLFRASVAEEVAARAGVPVLLTHPRSPAAAPAGERPEDGGE